MVHADKNKFRYISSKKTGICIVDVFASTKLLQEDFDKAIILELVFDSKTVYIY